MQLHSVRALTDIVHPPPGFLPFNFQEIQREKAATNAAQPSSVNGNPVVPLNQNACADIPPRPSQRAELAPATCRTGPSDTVVRQGLSAAHTVIGDES